jgi:hypothetical protein
MRTGSREHFEMLEREAEQAEREADAAHMDYESTTAAQIDRLMSIAQDTKKDFQKRKDTGAWYWFDRDERDNADAYHGPFPSFIAALNDATEPYQIDPCDPNKDAYDSEGD